MANVVSVKEMWSHVNSTAEMSSETVAWRATAARAYTVLFDGSARDNPVASLIATDGVRTVASLNEAWSAGVNYLYCQRKRVDVIGPMLYMVLCEFGGKSSPLSDPAKISWSGVKNIEAAAYDAEGKLYANVIGQRINDVRRPIYDRLARWTRNEADDAFAASSSYRGTVNKYNIALGGRTVLAGEALLDCIENERVLTGVDYYWPTTYLIQVRSGGWKRTELNQGTYYWDGTYKSSGVKRLQPCFADDGVTPMARRLTATGALLTPDAAADVKVLFDDYKIVDWAPLGFS